MSASARTVPAQAAGFGRFPTALAALALVVLLAVMVAIVALNGTKASTPAATGVGAPPIGYDHGSSNGEIQWGQSVTNVPFYDHGWSSATTYSLPVYEGPFVNQQNPGPAIKVVVPVPHGEYTGPFVNQQNPGPAIKATTSLGQDDPKPVIVKNTGSRPRNQ